MTNDKKVEKTSASGHTHIPKDWIETAAYFHWIKQGRPHGEHFSHWLEAENEVREWLEASGALKSKTPPQTAKKNTPHKSK
jgi:hypothetical protein